MPLFVRLSVCFVVALLLVVPTAQSQTSTDVAFSSGAISIGVVVSDLDASLAFYRDVIGMTPTRSFDISADFGQRSGLTNGTPVTVTVLKLEDHPQAAEWKLMSFGEEAAPPRSTHIQDDTGMQYITLLVNDLGPFIERLEAHGVPFLGDTPIPLGERHFVLVQDPDGTFVELIGPIKE